MSGKYCYDYPRASVTVDLVVFAEENGSPRVLMIRRQKDPFAGRWAFPGGFLEMEETIEAGARRELREETGLELPGRVEFLGAWTAPGRDPRGRTISLVHIARLEGPPPTPQGSDDASEAAWLDPAGLNGLAFDHDDILRAALGWIERSKS